MNLKDRLPQGENASGRIRKPENLTDDMHVYLIEGTYNMLDYKKMLDEGKKVWNEILDLVKKYGQQMND